MSTEETRLFDQEMQVYLSDPFRGTKERRLLTSGESAMSLELAAVRDVLAAAGMNIEEVELLLSGSFLPDHLGTGNAAYLAQELGLRGAAWNIESACSTAVVGLQTAFAMVASGAYENVLLVISCTYSRVHDEAETLGWFMGDGAGAILIGRVPDNEGVLGSSVIHTGETCGAAWYEAVPGEGRVDIRMRAGATTGKRFRETAAPTLRQVCNSAVEKAGVSLDDISAFAFATPTAWYASFCSKALGVPPEKAVNYYAYFGNMGPALTTTNLYFAAQSGQVKPGDLVLAYSVGSVSSAGAIVMRWSDVSLGPKPVL
ncbi:3-oxoacyl-ACP synthase III family protein [Streptomyces sp. NPDC086783]|uniref:3-oxoacyl-ACP synthase III family protein n=1 Tax=Streptomyces sp. NPDC086783 TaxID=3365758 RepID=UPI00382E4C92